MAPSVQNVALSLYKREDEMYVNLVVGADVDKEN